MRFSFWPWTASPWEELLSSARHVEATGWDGVWIADHFMPPGGDLEVPQHECWSVLAGLAAAVPRVRLGSIVSGNTYRHPAVLAKQAATIDHIAGGRLVLGIGAGWQENEHAAYGLEFSTVKGRMDMLEEACAVITSLVRERRTTFQGQHYRLTDAPLSPKPVGRLPLLVGGGGEQRTLRITARYADEWNVWGTPELLAQKNAVLNQRCEEIGRDPGEIQRSAVALLFISEDPAVLAPIREAQVGRPTIVGTPDEVVEVVAAYRDAGVDELLIPDFNLGAPQAKRDALDLFIERVAPAFR